MSFKIDNMAGLLEELKCATCRTLLYNSPVHNLDRTLHACHRCYPMGTRSHSFENLLNNFSFSCPNQHLGCSEYLKFNTVDQHKKNCKYKIFSCPKCKETDLTVKQLKLHINNTHLTSVVDPIVVDLSLIKQDKSVHFYNGSNESFIISVNHPNQRKFDFLVACIEQEPTNESYQYQLKFWSDNKNDVLIFPKRQVEPYEDISKLWNSENKLEVDLLTLQSALKSTLVKVKINIFHKDAEKDDGFKVTKIECQICLNPMTPPIFLCAIGHSFCGLCSSKLKSCPLCQKRMTGNRNYTLEELLGGASKGS